MFARVADLSALSAGAPTPTIWSMTTADDDEFDSDLGLGEQSDQWELDESELDADWERARTEALRQLCDGLAWLRGEAPPGPGIRAAAVKLRANLGSEAYPFPQLARALAGSSGQPPVEDAELLIRAVAATVAPLPESQEQELADGGDQDEGAEDEGAEDDLPLEMDTEELELEDWLALIIAAVRPGPAARLDPERLVVAAAMDPDSDDGWIKEGAFVRALSLWEDLGMLDGGGVTQVGKWILPRALARAWEGDFDGAG
jgi:hypothetical protein